MRRKRIRIHLKDEDHYLFSNDYIKHKLDNIKLKLIILKEIVYYNTIG